MDYGTIIGLIGGFGVVAWGILLNGTLASFVDIPGAIIVFGGATCSLFIMFPTRQVLAGDLLRHDHLADDLLYPDFHLFHSQ